MPKPLLIPTERVNWRIETSDVEFLNALFPRTVNTVMRELVHRYVERIRGQMGDGEG